MGEAVPGFVRKLAEMLADGAPGERLLDWSADGTSIVIKRAPEFARRVLPRFFKHANLSSFVRQLNMYGFHKVNASASAPPDEWEFAHPQFRRGRPDLLCTVRRRASEHGSALSAPVGDGHQPGSVNPALVKEIAALRAQQAALTADIASLRQDAQFLWDEARLSRERQAAQAAKVDRILFFLASVFSAPGERAVAEGGRSVLESLLSRHTEEAPAKRPPAPLLLAPPDAKRAAFEHDDMPPLFDGLDAGVRDAAETSAAISGDIDSLLLDLEDGPSFPADCDPL